MTAAIVFINGIMLISYHMSTNVLTTTWDRVVESLHYCMMPLVLTTSFIICFTQHKKSLHRFYLTAVKLFITAGITCFLYAVVKQNEAAIFLGSYLTSSCVIGSILVGSLLVITKDEKDKD